MVTAVMQIQPGAPEKGREPSPDNVLANAMAAEFGGPVHAVHLSMTMNTDDTKLLTWTGKSDTEVRLTAVENTGKHHAVYQTQNKAFNLGLSVAFTVSATAGGDLFPITARIGGLSEDEMPPALFPSGNLIHCVPGLSPAAARG